MAERFKGLRKMGAVGNFAATALVFITTNWLVVVNTVVAIGIGLWGWTFALATNQRFQIIIITFFLLFGAYVGVGLLWALRAGVNIRVVPDIKYCVNPEGYQFYVDPASVTDGNIQLAFNFRNMSAAPIKVRAQSFRVWIEDRSYPDPEALLGDLIIPRASARGIRSPAMKREIILQREVINVVLDVTALYGLAEEDFTRRYHFRTKLVCRFQRDDKDNVTGVAVVEDGMSDQDEAIA